MFSALAMKRVEMLVLEKDVWRVTLTLGKLGVLHITHSKEAEELAARQADKGEEGLTRCRQLLERAQRAATLLGVEAAEGIATDHVSLEEVEALLGQIEPSLGEIEEHDGKLGEQIGQKQGLVKELARYEELGIALEDLGRSSFLHFAMGSVPAKEAKDVAEAAAPRGVVVPFGEEGGRRYVVGVSSRKGKWTLQGTLEKHDFRAEAVGEKLEGAPGALIEEGLAQLAALDGEKRELEEKRKGLREMLGGALEAVLGRLELEERILAAGKDFARTWAAAAITGWVPAARVEEVVEGVLGVTSNRAVIEVRDPSEVPDEQAPTKLSNRGFLRPFEVFVTVFGLPGYREVEPTVLVAVSFLLMFGFMFGDVGQGGVIVLAGLAIWFFGKKQRVRDMGVILGAAGGAAVVFGFLYGSVFGSEDLIAPLWMNPLKEITAGGGDNAVYRFFGATVVLGFVMISIGLALNVVNRVRGREWGRLFFDKFGVVGIWFYWGLAAVGMRMLAAGEVGVWTIILFVLVPLGVIMCQEPIRLILAGRTGKSASSGEGEGAEEGPVLAFFFGIVEVFETLLSYLSNTLSFVRVAAFGLSHAALCLAVFALADLVGPAEGGASAGRIAVLVAGNAFIIVLEGLIAAIQTMRLEYYEFFGKFFGGGGRPYRPFSLETGSESQGSGPRTERSS